MLWLYVSENRRGNEYAVFIFVEYELHGQELCAVGLPLKPFFKVFYLSTIEFSATLCWSFIRLIKKSQVSLGSISALLAILFTWSHVSTATSPWTYETTRYVHTTTLLRVTSNPWRSRKKKSRITQTDRHQPPEYSRSTTEVFTVWCFLQAIKILCSLHPFKLLSIFPAPHFINQLQNYVDNCYDTVTGLNLLICFSARILYFWPAVSKALFVVML